jgi:hypothetical protein
MAAFDVLEVGGEGPPFVLVLLPGRVGREGVLASAAIARLYHRRQRPPSVLLGEALFSRPSPGYLNVATVSGGACSCLRLCHPPLGSHETPSFLIPMSHLERRSSALCSAAASTAWRSSGKSA